MAPPGLAGAIVCVLWLGVHTWVTAADYSGSPHSWCSTNGLDAPLAGVQLLEVVQLDPRNPCSLQDVEDISLLHEWAARAAAWRKSEEASQPPQVNQTDAVSENGASRSEPQQKQRYTFDSYLCGSTMRQAFDKHLQEHLQYLTQGYSRDDPWVILTLTSMSLVSLLAVSIARHRKRISRFLLEHGVLGAAWSLLKCSSGTGAESIPMNTTVTSQQRRAVAALLREAMSNADVAKLENAIAAAEAVSLEASLLARAKQALAERRRREREKGRAAASAARVPRKGAGGRHSYGPLNGTNASTHSYSTRGSSTSSVQGCAEECDVGDAEGEERGTSLWRVLRTMLSGLTGSSCSASSSMTSSSATSFSDHHADHLEHDISSSAADWPAEQVHSSQHGSDAASPYAALAKPSAGRGVHTASPAQRASPRHSCGATGLTEAELQMLAALDAEERSVEADDAGWQQQISRPRRNKAAKAATAQQQGSKGAPAPCATGSRLKAPSAGAVGTASSRQPAGQVAKQTAKATAMKQPQQVPSTPRATQVNQQSRHVQAREALLYKPKQQPTSAACQSGTNTNAGWLGWISNSVLSTSPPRQGHTGLPKQGAAAPPPPPPPPPPRSKPAKGNKQQAWASPTTAPAPDAAILHAASPIRTHGKGGKPTPSAAPGKPTGQAAQHSLAAKAVQQPLATTESPLPIRLGSSPDGKSMSFMGALGYWMGYGTATPGASAGLAASTYSSMTPSSPSDSPAPSTLQPMDSHHTSLDSSASIFNSPAHALPASLLDASPRAAAAARPLPSSRPLNPAAPSFRSMRESRPVGAASSTPALQPAASKQAQAAPFAPAPLGAAKQMGHTQMFLSPLSNLTGLPQTPEAIAAASAAAQRLRHDPFAEPLGPRRSSVMPMHEASSSSQQQLGLPQPHHTQTYSLFASNSVWGPSVQTDVTWDVAGAPAASWGLAAGAASLQLPAGAPFQEDLHTLLGDEELQACDLAQQVIRHVVES